MPLCGSASDSPPPGLRRQADKESRRFGARDPPARIDISVDLFDALRHRSSSSRWLCLFGYDLTMADLPSQVAPLLDRARESLAGCLGFAWLSLESESRVLATSEGWLPAHAEAALWLIADVPVAASLSGGPELGHRREVFTLEPGSRTFGLSDGRRLLVLRSDSRVSPGQGWATTRTLFETLTSIENG